MMNAERRDIVRLLRIAARQVLAGDAPSASPDAAVKAVLVSAATIVEIADGLEAAEREAERATSREFMMGLLLREWLETPFFETKEEWERWVAGFRPQVEEQLASAVLEPQGVAEGAEGIAERLRSRKYYELMQAYRNAPIGDQIAVVDAYWAVRDFLLQ